MRKSCVKAKRGLRRCHLPGCLEATVKEAHQAEWPKHTAAPFRKLQRPYYSFSKSVVRH